MIHLHDTPKNVQKLCLKLVSKNTNIYSYLDTSGGQALIYILI